MQNYRVDDTRENYEDALCWVHRGANSPAYFNEAALRMAQQPNFRKQSRISLRKISTKMVRISSDIEIVISTEPDRLQKFVLYERRRGNLPRSRAAAARRCAAPWSRAQA